MLDKLSMWSMVVVSMKRDWYTAMPSMSDLLAVFFAARMLWIIWLNFAILLQGIQHKRKVYCIEISLKSRYRHRHEFIADRDAPPIFQFVITVLAWHAWRTSLKMICRAKQRTWSVSCLSSFVTHVPRCWSMQFRSGGSISPVLKWMGA